MFRARFAALSAIALLAGSAAFAALSPRFAEWPKGPAQWLLTREEQRRWSAVTSDEQAQDFIDLFWARRDPTPGTPVNEFRKEFEARVAFADKNFARGGKRGALTDPGRVYILLGPPKNLGGQGAQQMSNSISGVDGFNTGRQMGEIMKFEYVNAVNLGLSAPVGFVEDPKTRELKIDYQQGNIAGALALAVDRAVVNRGLETVPEWGRSALWAAREPGTAEAVETAVTTTTVTKRTAAGAPTAAPGTAVQPGAHTLLLLENPRAIRVGEDNPFGPAIKKSSFRKSEDIGFAYQFCTAVTAKPKLTMSVTFDARIDGHPVNVSTPEDEVEAETITSIPGCYLVRGAIPLESLEPGSWTFYVNVRDAGTGQSYNLQREFKLE